MRTWKLWLTLPLLTAVTAMAGSGATTRIWNFENDSPGAIAKGFVAASGEWKVASTAEGNVLAQLAKSPAAVFNVALVDHTRAKDLDVSVKVRAMAGENDQGGGLIWRAKDAKNYYVARYNHLKDNFRVYKVVDGKRSAPFQNADVEHHDGWTVVRVTMTGDHIECYLDGKKHLDVHDSTFADAGQIGLWSKSDAQSHFDDLMLSAE